MTATVTHLDERRRKPPAWNPSTKRHSWTDVDGGHTCGFCTVSYHSEEIDGVWWKAWTLGERTGRTLKMPPCPGPPTAPGEATPAPVVLPAVTTTAHPCCRCVPPIQPCGLPTQPTVHGPLCKPQREAAGRARAAELVRRRSATSGMGVPTGRGGAA